MNNSRFLATTKQHTIYIIKSTLNVFLVVAALFFVSFIINLIIDLVSGAGLSRGEGGIINGIEAILVFAALVIGLVGYPVWLKSGMASGVSRKTEFLSVLVSILISAVAGVALCFLLKPTIKLVVPEAAYITLAEQTIFKGGWSFSPLQTVLFSIAFNFIGIVELFFLGYFLSALSYRLSKIMKFVVFCVMPIFLFVVLPIVISVINPEIMHRISDFITMVDASPVWSLLSPVIHTAVLGTLSYLLIRRAPLKTL